MNFYEQEMAKSCGYKEIHFIIDIKNNMVEWQSIRMDNQSHSTFITFYYFVTLFNHLIMQKMKESYTKAMIKCWKENYKEFENQRTDLCKSCKFLLTSIEHKVYCLNHNKGVKYV